MKEEKILKINGNEIKVVVIVIEPLTNLYRASAIYSDYNNSPISFHDHKDKEVAINVAVNKLIRECDPESLKYL